MIKPISLNEHQNYITQLSTIANVGKGLGNSMVNIAKQAEEAEMAQQASYLASLEADDIVSTNKIYNEHVLKNSTPEELASSLENYKLGKSKQMSDDIKSEYGSSFDLKAANIVSKFADKFYAQQKDKARVSLETSQEILRKDIFENPTPTSEIELQEYNSKLVKYKDILNARVEQGFLTSKEAEQDLHSIHKSSITLDIKAYLETLDADDRAKTIYDFSRQKPIKGLTKQDMMDVVENIKAYNNSLSSTENLAFAMEKANEQALIAEQKSDLAIGVSRGERTYEDIEQAYQNSIIDAPEKTKLVKELDKLNESNISKANQIQIVSEAINGGGLFNPKDKNTIEAVNTYYEEQVQPTNNMENTINLIKSTGIIPDKLKNTITAIGFNGSGEQKKYAGSILAQLQQEKPQTLDDIDKNTKNTLLYFNSLIENGMEIDDANEIIEDINSMKPSDKAVLEEDLKKYVTDKGRDKAIDGKKVSNILGDMYDEGLFSFNADIPSELEVQAIADFTNLYESYFLTTKGDTAFSLEQAKKDFNNGAWGVTKVNGGKQLIKFPIEKAYPNVAAEDIKKQLMKDLSEKGYDLDSDDVFIRPTKETQKYYPNNPPYEIWYINDRGELDVVNENNEWRFDVEKYNKVISERNRAIMNRNLAIRDTTPTGRWLPDKDGNIREFKNGL